jgi:GxxExxY protein
MEVDRKELNRLTERIIGCAFNVSNTLGCGFLEKVYENSLMIELTKNGLEARQQVPIEVIYDGFIVGNYTADILVEEKVILELKAVKELDDIHFAQCINYLKGTTLCVCLLLNFAKTKLEIKRVIND